MRKAVCNRSLLQNILSQLSQLSMESIFETLKWNLMFFSQSTRLHCWFTTQNLITQSALSTPLYTITLLNDWLTQLEHSPSNFHHQQNPNKRLARKTEAQEVFGGNFYDTRTFLMMISSRKFMRHLNIHITRRFIRCLTCWTSFR